jgi:H+/Cl- antiporter ClcA
MAEPAYAESRRLGHDTSEEARRGEVIARRLTAVAALLGLYPVVAVVVTAFDLYADLAVWPMRIGAGGYVFGTPVLCGCAAYLGRGRTRWAAATVCFLWLFVLVFMVYQFMGRCCLPPR